ncbi:hypothetical protein [Nitrosospira multiformis]|nr:hypothetical protein [Nitrosospira multiformis]
MDESRAIVDSTMGMRDLGTLGRELVELGPRRQQCRAGGGRVSND